MPEKVVDRLLNGSACGKRVNDEQCPRLSYMHAGLRGTAAIGSKHPHPKTVQIAVQVTVASSTNDTPKHTSCPVVSVDIVNHGLLPGWSPSVAPTIYLRGYARHGRPKGVAR